MKISIIVEGETERAFFPVLRSFLKTRLHNSMPKLDPVSTNGRIPKAAQLKKEVERLLGGKDPADHVIALTDVYTGQAKPDFQDATDAKQKMHDWVGDNGRFVPHAAQHDFEAWLLPYWERIQKLAGCQRKPPGARPEQVNHSKPPSHHIRDIFRLGGQSYGKVLHASRILKDQDLLISANACPELKAFLNTILKLSGGQELP